MSSWSPLVAAAQELVLTVDLVDLGVGGQDLICQLLSGGQHLCVVGCDQVLDQLLQLVPVHLEQRLRDGQPQLHLQQRKDGNIFN